MTAPVSLAIAERLVIAPALAEDGTRMLRLLLVSSDGAVMAADMDALKAVCAARLLDEVANGEELRTHSVALTN